MKGELLFHLARFVHLVVTFEFSPSRCDGTKKNDDAVSVFSSADDSPQRWSVRSGEAKITFQDA